jgi:hypothetical protein
MMLDLDGALRAYAAMMNTSNLEELEPLLADDFQYASQWVFAEIRSKQDFVNYIKPKLATVKASGATVWAEMGHLDQEFPGPCVVLAQGEKDNLIAIVLAQVDNGKIVRLDMCGAPSPRSAQRSGTYPGRPQ